MAHWLVFVFLLFGFVFCYSCQCTCCQGNGCDPTNAGSTPVSNCNDCSQETCANAFSTCPQVGSPGVSAATCSSGSVSTPWAGLYIADNECDQTQCCCLSGKLCVSQEGVQITVSGGTAGQCGGTVSWLCSATLNLPTDTTVSFDCAGNSYTATLDAGVSIYVQNNNNGACSGTGTYKGKKCSSSKKPDLKFIFIVIGIVLGALLFLAIVIGIAWYLIRHWDLERMGYQNIQ